MSLNKREAQRFVLGVVGALLAATGGWLVAQLTNPTTLVIGAVFGLFVVGCLAFAWFWGKLNRHRLFGVRLGAGLVEVGSAGQKPREENPSMPGWFIALTADRRLPPTIEVVADAAIYGEENICQGDNLLSATLRHPSPDTVVYEFNASHIEGGAFLWFAVFAPEPIRIVSVRAVP